VNWIKQRVWQMGIGAILILVGSWLIYAGAAGQAFNDFIFWLGFAFVLIGLLIPLIIKAFESAQEKEGEAGEC